MLVQFRQISNPDALNRRRVHPANDMILKPVRPLTSYTGITLQEPP